jgi:hypothetical protein
MRMRADYWNAKSCGYVCLAMCVWLCVFGYVCVCLCVCVCVCVQWCSHGRALLLREAKQKKKIEKKSKRANLTFLPVWLETWKRKHIEIYKIDVLLIVARGSNSELGLGLGLGWKK